MTDKGEKQCLGCSGPVVKTDAIVVDEVSNSAVYEVCGKGWCHPECFDTLCEEHGIEVEQ